MMADKRQAMIVRTRKLWLASYVLVLLVVVSTLGSTLDCHEGVVFQSAQLVGGLPPVCGWSRCWTATNICTISTTARQQSALSG